MTNDEIVKEAMCRETNLEDRIRWAVERTLIEAASEASSFASDSEKLGQHWAANQLIDLATTLRGRVPVEML